MTTKRLCYLLAAAGLVGGCTGGKSDAAPTAGSIGSGQTMGTTGSGNDSMTGPVQTSGPGTVGTTTTDPSAGSDGSSGSTGGTGCTFLCQTDAGNKSIECSVWNQDCPDGQKCMPWANDGGNSWNATKCTAVDPSPAQPGDSCTAQGSGVSGVDNCDVASMCWNVDPMTNMGTCVGFCSGTDTSPVCDDPMTSCSIANDGTLILCLPNCDPLLQDCADGEACYPIADGFVCAPDASGTPGVYGDPCEYLNACDPGLACLDSSAVPGCTGSTGCCSPYCDTSDPNAGANCPGASGGQMCTSAFDMGAAPPGYENVGFCAIPA